MIDPEAKPAPYIKLLALVAVLGLISALVTFVFVALVHQGTALVWEQAALALGIDPRLFTVLICTLGGLVVGLFATSLLLATGWKGGYIFPIMFASVALGLAANLLFPGIPVAVTVAATMAGALVAALKAPLFAALFTLALVQSETSAVVAVAVVVSALLTALLALRAARRAPGQAQALPEPK